MWSSIFAKRSTAAVVSAKKTASLLPTFHRIVVPAVGAPFSQRALRIACRLAKSHLDSEIHLVYFMEVPRAFSLSASLPGEEALAESVLYAGTRSVHDWNCSAISEVQRGRDLQETLLKYLVQSNADVVVLGARPDNVRGIPVAMARELYDRAPCPVILDFIAGEVVATSLTVDEPENSAN